MLEQPRQAEKTNKNGIRHPVQRGSMGIANGCTMLWTGHQELYSSETERAQLVAGADVSATSFTPSGVRSFYVPFAIPKGSR